MTIRVRLARADDRDRLLHWRNHPETRRYAFTQEPVAPEVHAAWLKHKLADPDSEIWIAEQDGKPVGQVRLDRVRCDAAEIDIAVDEDVRGRGVGTELLKAVIDRHGLPVARVRALIMPGNVASARAFSKAGFVEIERDECCIVMEYLLETERTSASDRPPG